MKIFGIAGYSGSGKTTLLERVIPVLVRDGLRVSVIKHAHCGFDVDRPGKDSYRHRQAGATEVLISGGERWVLMHELRGAAEHSLQELLPRLSVCDVVLVEGFKNEALPKLEVHRRNSGRPLLFPFDANIVGIATDEPLATDLPQIDVDDPEAVAYFIMNYLGCGSQEMSLLA